MVIDIILDRYDGFGYSARRFYHYVLGYNDEISRVMDYGTEQDVKKALKLYVINNGYNLNICDYIDMVDWLEDEAPTYKRFEKLDILENMDADNEAYKEHKARLLKEV